MPIMTFTDEALKYKNQWVAFSADLKRVVGHGDTSLEAADMAEADGELHAFLLFIPESWPEAMVF